MRRSFILGLLGLALGFHLQAQKVYHLDSTYYSVQPVPQLAVHWLASQHLGRFSAHMFSIEHRIADRINLEHGIGVIYNRNVIEDDEIYFNRKRGFKSSTKIKFYHKSDRSFQPFYGLEAFFNHRNYERTRTFELSCGADCTFFESRTYNIENNSLGLRINAGLISPISSRFYLEMEAGMGIQQSNLTSSGKPHEFIRRFGRLFAEDETLTNYALNLNIKLAYLIK